MEKTELLGGMAGLFFISIFFTPLESDIWKGFLFLGLIFGVGWWFKS